MYSSTCSSVHLRARTRVLTIYLKSTSGTRTHLREQKKGTLGIGRVVVARTQTEVIGTRVLQGMYVIWVSTRVRTRTRVLVVPWYSSIAIAYTCTRACICNTRVVLEYTYTMIQSYSSTYTCTCGAVVHRSCVFRFVAYSYSSTITMLSLGPSTATLTMPICLTKVGLSLMHMPRGIQL